jgi:uncharacterized membrane protein YkgB
MKSRIVGRIIAAIILAVLIGLYDHHMHVAGSQMGRDAFIAKETARFDRHFATPDPVVVDVMSSIILFGIFFCVYELIAFVASKILQKPMADSERLSN